MTDETKHVASVLTAEDAWAEHAKSCNECVRREATEEELARYIKRPTGRVTMVTTLCAKARELFEVWQHERNKTL